METISTEEPRWFRRSLVKVCLTAAILTCLVVACGRLLSKTSIKDSLDDSSPALNLNLAWYNSSNELIDVNTGKAIAVTPTVAPQPTATASQTVATNQEYSGRCPTIVGGDINRKYQEPEGLSEEELAKCPKEVEWHVVRNPVAFTFAISNGQNFLNWFDDFPGMKSFVDSTLFRGAIRDLAILSKARADVLKLDGLKGEFLKPIIREIVSADATLYYDIYRGKDGFVLSFVREKAPLAAAALPIVVKFLTKVSYNVPDYEQPLAELALQGQKIIVTEKDGRVYLGNAVETLINVISQVGTNKVLPGSATVDVRADAFLAKVLRPLTGSDKWSAAFSFALSEKEGKPEEGQFDPARVYSTFSPKVATGVLAAIPADVFGAFITSASIPTDVAPCDWKGFVDGTAKSESKPAAEGGIAFLWDIQSAKADTTSAVGVVVNAPEGIDPEVFNELFNGADEGLVTNCSGGAIWIAASSTTLLTRMKESCDKQSKSLLDWKDGGVKDQIQAGQSSLFLNFNVGLKQLYERGGGGVVKAADASTPVDGDEVAMEKAIAADVEKTAAQLPIVGYSGKLAENGALKMKGFVLGEVQ